MNRKLLFLLCVPLLFAGCESPAGVAHYRYGNRTDRIIQVEAPNTDDYGNPCTFELAPGEEYELTYMHARSVVLPPFVSSIEYVRISDGEREVTFVSRPEQAGQKTYLYDVESYRLVKSKKYEYWFRYDFTDRDFEDGVPINGE